MSGLIGKKIGMTSLYDSDGSMVACTVIEAAPNVVTHVKTLEKDGYQAVQLSYGERREKNTPAALMGHFKKANTTPKVKAHEFKEFETELFDPRAQQLSSEYRIAGKVDGIVRCHDGLYLLEHKTATVVDGNYLDKLWTDTQIALYGYYLRRLGYPIVGVIYNVLVKSRLKQAMGETQAEYEQRLAELAAKNKSGKSNAKSIPTLPVSG